MYVMVKIRLSQTGTKNAKKYRIVAIEEGKRRDGQAIEILGYFNPEVKPAALKFDRQRIDYWLSVGAQLSPKTRKLLDIKP
jgi:small subunit ribosomal protein S16